MPELPEPFVPPARPPAPTPGRAPVHVEVTGGPADIAANLDDIRAAALALRAAAGDVGTLLLDATASGAAGLLDSDSVACPLTASSAAADVAAVLGTTGLPHSALEIGALATRTALVATFYDEYDAVTKDGFTQARLNEIRTGTPLFSCGNDGVMMRFYADESLGAMMTSALHGHNPLPTELNHWLDLAPVSGDEAARLVGTILGPTYVPGTAEERTKTIARGATLLGYDDTPVVVGEPRHTRGTPGPASIESLVRGTEMEHPEKDAADDGYELKITRITRPDGTGSWVVTFPGTQNWGPTDTRTSADLTTNLALMSEGDCEAKRAAMRAIQARIGDSKDPVLLVGHSQGGIMAGAFASDPEFTSRYRVPAALVAGAPTSRMSIAPGTHVLALENVQDSVPVLDGKGNPDRANVTTARRDMVTDPRADAAELAKKGSTPDHGLMQAHGLTAYLETAAGVDASDAPSVQAWREDAAPFLQGGTAEEWTYDLTRERAGSTEALAVAPVAPLVPVAEAMVRP